MVYPFGPVLWKIADGDDAALLRGLACLVASWFETCGTDISQRPYIRTTTCLSAQTPVQQGLMAAACDLYDVMSLSPQGRKALLDFRDDPVLEQAKGE